MERSRGGCSAHHRHNSSQFNSRLRKRQPVRNRWQNSSSMRSTRCLASTLVCAPIIQRASSLKARLRRVPSAASLTKAAHLQKRKAPIPVTVRFSAGSGLPTVPDTNDMPRGMAVKFALPDGTKTDLVVLSFNGFPVANAEEFRDFSARGRRKRPRRSKTHRDWKNSWGAHPAAKAFVETPKPPPVSYGTLPYFGINAFKLTNAKGTATHVRYQLQPVTGDKYLSKEQVAAMAPDYLTDEIRERVRRGPVKFNLLAQVAEQGDTIDNPTIVQPDTRKKVKMGTIAPITKAVADSQAAEKKLLFVPGALVPGIEAANPMIERTVGGLHCVALASSPGPIAE